MKWKYRRIKDNKPSRRKGRGGTLEIRKTPYWKKQPARNNVNDAKLPMLVVGKSYKARITSICETGNAIAYYDGIRVIIDPCQTKVYTRDLVEFEITEIGLYHRAVLKKIAQYGTPRELPVF